MAATPTTWTFRILWIVLVLASIPIILDYIDHVLGHSWAWYVWVFPVCVVSSVRRTKRRAARTIPAILLIVLGVIIEIYASASGILRLGRPGFLLVASGVLEADGRLDFRRFVMMTLAIPIPHTLLTIIGTPLLFLNVTLLKHTLQALCIPALATAQGIERPIGMVAFKAVDVGWTSAIFAFGLVWVLFASRRSSLLQALIGSAVAALVGFLIHLLCTTALFAAMDPSELADARIWRDAVSYSVIGAATVAYWFFALRGKPRSDS